MRSLPTVSLSMSPSMSLSIAAVLLALSAWWLARSATDAAGGPALADAAVEPSAATPTLPPTSAPPIRTAAAPVAFAPGAPASVQDGAPGLRLPDGTRVALLNGATRDVELVWPADRAFSPIVGTRRHAGLDWYVHADGTQSTTQVVFRADLGREDVVAVVGAPITVAPVELR